jgi:type IV secretory pathway component VirB8
VERLAELTDAKAGNKRSHAQNWLTQKDREKQADTQEGQEAREDEANKNAKKINRMAWITAAIAAIAAGIAAVALVWGR